jgi:hypothetical protein
MLVYDPSFQAAKRGKKQQPTVTKKGRKQQQRMDVPVALPLGWMDDGNVKTRATAKVRAFIKQFQHAAPKARKPTGTKKGRQLLEEWRKKWVKPERTFERDTTVDFLSHESDAQTGATTIFYEEMIRHFEEAFPQYKGMWGDLTACFAKQASKQWAHGKPNMAKVFALMFFATDRLFGTSGQRLAAVLRKNKTSTQAEGSNSVYDFCVQEVLHSYSQVGAM